MLCELRDLGVHCGGGSTRSAPLRMTEVDSVPHAMPRARAGGDRRMRERLLSRSVSAPETLSRSILWQARRGRPFGTPGPCETSASWKPTCAIFRFVTGRSTIQENYSIVFDRLLPGIGHYIPEAEAGARFDQGALRNVAVTRWANNSGCGIGETGQK